VIDDRDEDGSNGIESRNGKGHGDGLRRATAAIHRDECAPMSLLRWGRHRIGAGGGDRTHDSTRGDLPEVQANP
jgi:hypothetical protein